MEELQAVSGPFEQPVEAELAHEAPSVEPNIGAEPGVVCENEKAAEVPEETPAEPPEGEKVTDESIANAVSEVLNEVEQENIHNSEKDAQQPEETQEFLQDDKTSDSKRSHGSSSNKKKRRRIVIDDSDDDGAELRDEIPKSPSPSKSESEEVEENTESIEALEAKVNEVMAAEKPGPKSKKNSTQLLKQLEIKSLLQNAVVIPAKKKRGRKPKSGLTKKRILDSDEEQENSVELDISDIGLVGDDITSPCSLLPENSDPNAAPGEPVEEMCEVMTIENPILPQEDGNENVGNLQKTDDEDDKDESEDENETEEPEKEAESEPETEPPEVPIIKVEVPEKPRVIKLEPAPDSEALNLIQLPVSESIITPVTAVPVAEATYPTSGDEPTTLTDLSTKTPKTVIKQEPCDQADAEKFLADALKSQFSTDSPKMKVKKEVKEEVFSVTNSTFWGRDSSSDDDWPDESRKSRRSRDHARGMRGSRKRRRSRYSSDSEETTEETTSETSSSDEDTPRRKRGRPKKGDVTTVSMRKVKGSSGSYMKSMRSVAVNRKAELKRKVKDRFFDRSRLVPNDIYFGDVQVPLHVLHSYNSDAFSSSSDDNGYYGRSSSSKKYGSYSRKPNVTKIKIDYGVMQPREDSLIATMKEYLRAAGIRKIKFSRLWEGCKSNAERANAMLRLLREKGLLGEPTMAKCKALRKKREAKKEIEELDTSVIIDDDASNDGIRTRRATRGVKVKEEDDVAAAGLETLNKLKQVIDTDSE